MENLMHYIGVQSTAQKQGGGSFEENENQPIHQVLRPDQLMSFVGYYVWSSADRAWDSPIMI
jgi:hypothetical protein